MLELSNRLAYLSPSQEKGEKVLDPLPCLVSSFSGTPFKVNPFARCCLRSEKPGNETRVVKSELLLKRKLDCTALNDLYKHTGKVINIIIMQ